MRAIGIKEFLDKKFDVYPFEGKFFDSFGGNKNFVIWEGRRNNLRDLFNQDIAKAL